MNGTFAGSMTLDYASSPASVDLNVTGASLLTTPSGANQNQQNVIGGINNGILNSPANLPLPSQFLGLGGLSGPSLLGAATHLDGEANTGAERAALQLTNQFLALMLDPFVYGRGGVGSTSAAIGFARRTSGQICRPTSRQVAARDRRRTGIGVGAAQGG